MRFDDNLLDEIRERLPVTTVVARRVKLRKQGREWAGLSPFTNEKTPSFFVNDIKGRWFDFSAGKNGDIFTFLMETEGISFPEAVERLAQEAGVTLPEASPQNAERAAQRRSLTEVLQEAIGFYRSSLRASKRALEYVRSRKIEPGELETFEIGFAPDDKSALKSFLADQHVDPELVAQAGLLITGDDIPVSYDRFRDRLMFPIHDAKGQPVGFGGRDLSGNSPAKYLNTSETPVFDKGRLIYNAHRARQAAHEGSPLLVVEGYMGTVANVRAGFPATVATMGTALTPHHLRSLWRMSDCPILVFDGDRAGREASGRAIRTALPLMVPGKKMRLVSLPMGLDPDDVVTKQGPDAYRGMIEHSVRLVDALWEIETAGKMLSVPDDRAEVENALLEAADTIADPTLRDQYRREYRDRVRSLPMRRAKPLRSNSHSSHSITPGRLNLTHRPNGSMNLRTAMLTLAILQAPGAALGMAESLTADKSLTDIIGRAIDVLAEIPEATTEELLAALERIGLGDAIETARTVCRQAGITADEKMAAQLLGRMH